MAWVVHSDWLERQMDGTDALDLDSAVGGDTIKLAIVTESTIDEDVIDTIGDLTLVGTATGWTGPVTLASITCGLDGSANVVFDANDPSQIAQDGSGFTDGRSLVIYDDTNDFILAHHIEGSAFGNTTGPIDITFAAGGIFEFTI
jgi:hypothetical protein